jgi:hypothetical protein
VQTLIIGGLTLIIFQDIRQKKQQRHEDQKLGTLTHEEDNKRFLMQMKILAIFYMTTSFLDWIFHHYSIKEIENGHLTCTNSIYITVADIQGAWFMLLDSLVQYIYTFTIVIVFYEVPKRVYG